MSEIGNIIITEITGVGIIPSPRGRDLQIRNRRQFALSFCFDDGQVTYTVDGREYVSNKQTAIILPECASYRLHGDETGDFPTINFHATEAFKAKTPIVYHLQNTSGYAIDFKRMLTLWNTGGAQAEMKSVFYSIISKISEEENPRHKALSASMEYLGGNIFDPKLSVEELSRQANMSDVYFRKMFKKEYGVSPKQYILELRIRYAKQLLEENSVTVAAVAESCGFASVYHFCRAFKQITGVTPTEYALGRS